MTRRDDILHTAYDALFAAFGPQHWWPGDTPFEVVVGAILTQNTAWSNVERAIANLKRERVLSPRALRDIHPRRLARLIRPSGYFNIKAKRLKDFMRWLFAAHGGSLTRMFRRDLHTLRQQLLAVNGIGPETADSILLYAGQKPIFVVDAYTKRILSRHGLVAADASYDDVQRLFHAALPADVQLYNEFHALLVRLGKDYCQKRQPRCVECPLRAVLPPSRIGVQTSVRPVRLHSQGRR